MKFNSNTQEDLNEIQQYIAEEPYVEENIITNINNNIDIVLFIKY